MLHRPKKGYRGPKIITNAQKIELDVATFIKINSIKTNLSEVNKEVEITRTSIQKLWKEKRRLEEHEEAKKKAIE